MQIRKIQLQHPQLELFHPQPELIDWHMLLRETQAKGEDLVSQAASRICANSTAAPRGEGGQS
jgi:hypothetical protein